MLPACEVLDSIGYYSLECWGGATFDACLRFLNEDPWERLRQLRKHLPNTKLQMLFRGQNILGYKHYADDVVDAFCGKSIENGIDIIRIFDALNDVRNLEQRHQVHQEIRRSGARPLISYTISPVHNEDYFVKLAKELEQMGADALCIKDMANLLLPDGRLLPCQAPQGDRQHPHPPAHPQHQRHGRHGLPDGRRWRASTLSTPRSRPLANGTSQPATESLVATLKGTPRDTGLDLNKHERGRRPLPQGGGSSSRPSGALDPKVLNVDTNTLLYQVPGGMLSNLISQLKQAERRG